MTADQFEKESSLASDCVLALDYGARRIGLAIKPPGQTMALPLEIIDAKLEANVQEKIRRIIQDRKVKLVVTGLPVNPDPAQMRKTKKFTRKLRKGISGVRWKFVDETLSSAEAQSRLAAIGGKGRAPIDDQAAVIILETFLATSDGSETETSDKGDQNLSV